MVGGMVGGSMLLREGGRWFMYLTPLERKCFG